MKRINLTKAEKQLEDEMVKVKWVPVSKAENAAIAKALKARKKDAVLNIRVNSQDLSQIKKKAKKLGVKYQTFISEVLHQVAQ